jgi:hypothetical protein
MYQLMKTVLFLAFILRGGNIRIQAFDIKTVYLSNWCVGMLNPFLQILTYGKNISALRMPFAPYADRVCFFVHTTKT